jgi:hypothetical protein
MRLIVLGVKNFRFKIIFYQLNIREGKVESINVEG